MTTLYLIRHGEVYNPEGIIYGRLPNFGLSDRGRAQIEQAAINLTREKNIDTLFASPMQRAQESATIISQQLALRIETDERIIETNIGTFQGKRFEDLPKPYISEGGAHPEIESARSMRLRFLDWVTDVQKRFPDGAVAAVSHRDPIIVALLHWSGGQLDQLPDFALNPGDVYAVSLKTNPEVRALS